MSILGLYFIAFIGLIALSMPIAFALGFSTFAVFWSGDQPLPLAAQRLWNGLDKFPLVAIPLFIVAGELMGGSDILSRLLDFARLLVGRIRGSLLHLNILVSMFLGGINGSAIADTSAVGAMMIKATEREYGDAELAAATTAVSSVVGPIIPPSLPANADLCLRRQQWVGRGTVSGRYRVGCPARPVDAGRHGDIGAAQKLSDHHTMLQFT